MTTMKKNFLKLLYIAVFISIIFTVNREGSAKYSDDPVDTVKVEIDGINFGSFSTVEGLNDFSIFGLPLARDKGYVKVTLSRDFVTSPSLYLWAKNNMQKKFGPRDIHLISLGLDGKEISRQVLNYCQPLSWSIEAKNTSLGGFNERIDIAVQKISEN